MAKIERIELRLVDIPPKVKRTDAIQTFVSQETPIVAITDSDGVVGTGYSYTIGTGGSSVIKLLDDHLVPRLLHRDADDIERIWRDLFLFVHSTTVGTDSRTICKYSQNPPFLTYPPQSIHSASITGNGGFRYLVWNPPPGKLWQLRGRDS